MKSRILGKFGFSISTPNKSSAFDWNNSRTFIKGILSSEKSCEKPELLHILSELNISQKVLELFQSKAELRVLFGMDIENPNFPQSSAFH